MAEQNTPSRGKESRNKAKQPKRHAGNQKENAVEENGEYGFYKNENFYALCNFVLKCGGVVVEGEDIIGYMVRAKPKNNRNEDEAAWLESVFITRRDTSDQYTIMNKLGSSRLWISSNKDFLPAILKNMCDNYEKDETSIKFLPVKVFGLQPKSNPPVWVFGKDMQLKLENNKVIRLAEHESPYAIIGDCCHAYTYKGELDAGESLRNLLVHLEQFFGNDIYAAILVIGGVAMSFHFSLLHSIIGGVPPTLAIGDPVSGKSTAVESAMAIFDQRECIGAGSEAKLLDTLVNRTIPMWWDDIDNILILEKLTVLLYNKAKKVTLGHDRVGSALPVISINHTKLLKGFKKLKLGSEDFHRLFTRMLPIPFARRVSKQSLKDRINGKSQLEALLKKVKRSLPVILKLHHDFITMTEDDLFDDIQNLTSSFELDVRSEMNFAILLFSTGKMLTHIGLADEYWAGVQTFMTEQMVPKYKNLLSGIVGGNVQVQSAVTNNNQVEFFNALEVLFKKIVKHPDKAQLFFKANLKTVSCSCGEAIAVSLCKAVPFADLEMSTGALRHHIVANGIGCAGKSMRIGNTSTACVHISRRKIPPRLLEIIDGENTGTTSVMIYPGPPAEHNKVEEEAEFEKYEVEEEAEFEKYEVEENKFEKCKFGKDEVGQDEVEVEIRNDDKSDFLQTTTTKRRRVDHLFDDLTSLYTPLMDSRRSSKK